MGVKEKREAVQRRSKAILVEMMYLPLKKRLKSTDVRRVRVNYGLVACGVCCKKPALCCFLTLMVNCVTWKTERHVNKPLLFPVMAVMVRRQVTRQQLRAWMVPDNSLNEVQTCMTLPPPTTFTHWTEQALLYSQAPTYFSTTLRTVFSTCLHSASIWCVRCRKLILKRFPTGCLPHTHTHCVHIDLHDSWTWMR